MPKYIIVATPVKGGRPINVDHAKDRIEAEYLAESIADAMPSYRIAIKPIHRRITHAQN